MTEARPKIRWKAQPRQYEFLRRTEDEVLYGGAKGGGKSDALLVAGIQHCREHAGTGVLFLRKTFKHLTQVGAAIPRSHELLTGSARWNGENHSWTFPNGSVLKFGHMETSNDKFQYQGAQIDLLLVDEATQFLWDDLNYVRGSIRASVAGSTPRLRLSANPGGIGHNAIKQRYIDAAPPNTSFAIQEEGSRVSACFIPAKVQDNMALLERDPEYVNRLKSLGGTLSRAFLDGDWDEFAGQYFTEFRRDVHVCEPFTIPEAWPRWRGIDWGYSSPFACLWVTRSPSKDIYVYRELYGTGWLDHEQGMYMRTLSAGEVYRSTFADPSIWDTQPNGTSIAGVYAEEGVYATKANNKRVAGWQQVRNALAWQAEDVNRGLAFLPPKLHIFNTCTNLIRELPGLVHDAINVEDVDTDGVDHASDVLRYVLQGMYLMPTNPPPARTSYTIGGNRR